MGINGEIMFYLHKAPPKKGLWFRVICVRAACDPSISIFSFLWLCVGYETMSNCSKHLPNRSEFWRAAFSTTLSDRGTNVCPICEASLSFATCTLCMGNQIPITASCIHVSHISLVGKNVSPLRFGSRPMTTNRRLFWLWPNIMVK